jgi:hypothetical protein
MATSKGQRGSSGNGKTPSSSKNDGSHTSHSSQADGSVTQDSGENTSTPTKARDSQQRGRNTRSGDGASTQRRGKNQPGQYQKRDDEESSLNASENDAGTGQTNVRGSASGNMESAFDDEDMEGGALDDYETDEGDGDIDWDDSVPPRGGGKGPDR